MTQHDQWRLSDLDTAVQRKPQAPVNYLLRGEFWLELGEAHKAKADLQQACELAAQCLEKSDWGYIYQSYIDRAEDMLRHLR
jgi:hypothetical protein